MRDSVAKYNLKFKESKLWQVVELILNCPDGKIITNSMNSVENGFRIQFLEIVFGIKIVDDQ